MHLAAQFFSIPSLTLAAAVETLIVVKFYGDLFPRVFGSNSHMEIAVVILLANYAFAGLFWGCIYPQFLSPLRHVDGPKVCKQLRIEAAVGHITSANRVYAELLQPRSSESDGE